MSNPEQKTQEVIRLPDCRLSYLYAYRPYVGTNTEGKQASSYCVHALLDPNTPRGAANIRTAKDAINKVAVAAWGAQAGSVLQQLMQTDKLCLHNGDVTKMGEEAYAGKLYISANHKVKPRVVVTRGGVITEINSDDPCAPYSGCWGEVVVAIYAQGPNSKPSKWGKRVNAQFMGVQFLRHDEAFGGGRIATPEEFGVAPTDADGAVPMTAPAGAGSGLL